MKRRRIGEERTNGFPKLNNFGALELNVDPVNEQLLVISACMDREIRKGLTQRVRPDIFMTDRHQVIWEGLVEIAHVPICLANCLFARNHGLLRSCGAAGTHRPIPTASTLRHAPSLPQIGSDRIQPDNAATESNAGLLRCRR